MQIPYQPPNNGSIIIGSLCGDLNGDGDVTTADVVIALGITAGSHPFDPAADVSGDGIVTSLDALMFLQAVAGNIELQGGES